MSAVTVTTTPALITSDSQTDVRFYIQNRGPSEVFIGPDNTLTAANGIGLTVGAILEFPSPWVPGRRVPQAWICTATGTADVRWVMI